MRNLKILVVLFAFVITGCAVSPTSEPTQQIGFPINTLSIPTRPISTTTPTQTLPTPTLTEIPSLATQQALIDGFKKYCTEPITHSIRFSDNEQWVTVPCYTINGQSINFISADESKHWELPYFELYGSKHNSAEGNVSVSHWSKDGNYVYITVFPQMDGGGGFAFIEAAALYRLDLNSGHVTETLSSGTSKRKYYSLGFSPNDRRLAYFDISAKPFSLKIRDFQTGEDETINLGSKYNTGGNLIWSNNGQLLVFSAAYYDDMSDIYFVSVLLWDNQKKILETLIDDFDVALIPIKWHEETKIILEDRFSVDPPSYEFDLNSKTLRPIPP